MGRWPRWFYNAITIVKNKDIQISALLVIGFTALYLSTASLGSVWWGDSGKMMVVSQRILEHGFGPAPADHEGAEFSKFGLGQSLVDLPAAWAWARWDAAHSDEERFFLLLACAVGAVIGAMTNGLVFVVLRQLGYGRREAVIAAVVCGCSTMVWVYTQSLFSDPTIGLCWMAGLSMLLAYRRSGRRGWLAGAGAAIMFTVMCKVAVALAVAPFVAYAAHLVHGRCKEKVWRTLIWMVAPMAGVVAVMLWYNHLRYANWLAFGYSDGRDEGLGFSTPVLVGLYGLLFSSGKGFFFYNPSAILGLIGWRRFRHRHLPEALLVLGVCVLVLAVYAPWWSWSGDWAWGPRFLVGLIPLLMILTAPVWQGVRLASMKCAALLALALLGMAIQIGGLLVEREQYIQVVIKDHNVFQYVGYHRDVWPIRDDSLQLHFIPEFSPLVGHWWLYRCVLNRDNPAALARLHQSPPWRGLNKKWVKDQPNLERLRQHIWWLYHGEPGSAAVLLLLTATALGAAIAISGRGTPAD